MQDKDLIKISVSKIIPAQKWKLIRMITRVWEFPSFVPSVKEAKVIEKSKNKLITKWKVQVNGVPVSWVEEDILNLDKDMIVFRATEGDLQEFKGEWKLKSCPSGTKVSVTVYLKVGIPAIKDFAEPYMKKLLSANFEAILNALEKRAVSLRYKSFKKGNKDTIAGFGVIGHFYNYNHLANCLKMLNPAFKMPSREFMSQLFNITPSFKLYDLPEFKSKTGDVTNGRFIVATFIPDMMEKDMWSIFAKVVRACRIAEKYGVGVVALGGFTSIVGERIGHEIAKEVDVPVTTGNTFTAAMALEGVYKASRLLELEMKSSKAVIVGGTGDIGSGCARVLANKVGQLTVTGRTKANLKKLNKELSRKRNTTIIATTDNRKAVEDADIVITAASATSSILNVEWFKPGAIICDVGYPKNISYAPVTRQDILIFSGGLAKSPTPVSFPVDTGLPSKDTLYGCFSEAVILALEKRFESYSFGRGHITPEKIEEIAQMGKKHGFEVSDFYWGHSLVNQPMLEGVKEVISA